jgi:1-pyrroline-5-carboxylate dehydrogenase
MNNAIYNFGEPVNEKVLMYAPGSTERELIKSELADQENKVIEIPLIIGGREIRTDLTGTIVKPTDHRHVLATYHMATAREAAMAAEAALEAKCEWMSLSWTDRASVFLKAAELISKKYRYLLNAATMLGQGKNVQQAEIDSACEVIDYLRFNAHFASLIYGEQPVSGDQSINRIEYRPLEGFIYTINPFNFTAIASNLSTSVALMGNTAVWKPATASLLSSYYLMKIYMEAGVPGGVINFLPGPGNVISEVLLRHRDFAGIHFTGSNPTFNSLWQAIARNLPLYRSYPRIVGETGGKDFVFAHSSADPSELAVAIARGAFEYQGQKCSAASRAYIPESLWPRTREKLLDIISGIRIGDVTDLGCFLNAVIDEASFDKIMKYIKIAEASDDAEIIAGGKGDKSSGYFIEPTVIVTEDPHFITMEEEIFGPVITIYIYPDKDFEDALRLCDETSPFGLTGSVFGNDRYAVIKAGRALRYSAGNFYINDKPTGAMVGQQPFGGARASGTNDKAGSYLNLIRWISPRTIKETLDPPRKFGYPFME